MAKGAGGGNSGDAENARDIRRRDALLLDAVAEMQDMMGAQQVVMENAFAAQSKMLGDVIHGCWVRPKPGDSCHQDIHDFIPVCYGPEPPRI